MTITKQVLNRLKCECVLVPFLVAHAHWYKGPVIMQSKRPVIMFSKCGLSTIVALWQRLKKLTRNKTCAETNFGQAAVITRMHFPPQLVSRVSAR